MSEARRVGVYGGTFDPIHFGHLAIAEEARVALGLHLVHFIPAAHQPLKGAAAGARPEQRLAMVRLACADNPAFVPDDLELRRPPPSYTADTLELLQQRFGPAVELWFVLGADAARDLQRWRRVADILAIARLVIVGRPGYRLDRDALEAALPAMRGRYVLLDGPGLDLSSTMLRQRLASGRPVRYLLPEAVRRYITEQQLYRSDEPNG